MKNLVKWFVKKYATTATTATNTASSACKDESCTVGVACSDGSCNP